MINPKAITTPEQTTVEAVRAKYGSVSKMISVVNNEMERLKEYGGYFGRDGADTLERALLLIPRKFHAIYYKWAHTFPRP